MGFYLLWIFSSCRFTNDKGESVNQYASLNDSTKYAGMNSCIKCHSDKYETYIKTGMGLSLNVASREKSSGKFSGVSFIRDTIKNLNYRLFWKNDSLMVEEFRLSGRDTVYQREEKISWIVGSGQHTNSHMMNVNGYVYQVPATYYTQKGKWDLPPGFEHGFNSRFNRTIELECMTCHNGYPEIVPGSENKYSVIPNGIDCERCHGPGGSHIKAKLAGEIVDVKNAIDYTIVNPAKLPIDLQLDVCQRCHIQGNAVLKDGKSFLDFRPGMHLYDVMDVYMPLYKGDDDSHIMASHVERMKMSKCFLVSVSRSDSINRKNPTLTPYKNAMTCVTCHDPHVSVMATDQTVFNAKCVSCHSSDHKNPVATVFCTETKKARIAAKDNCVGCHMPKNGTIDIPHVTTTDHRISVPLKVKEVKKIKEFAGLACINNPNSGIHSMGSAFLSYYEKFSPNPAYLDSAKKYINDSKKDSIESNFKNLIRWAFLKNDFNLVINYVNQYKDANGRLTTRSFSNDDAWTAYRIGESYGTTGDNKNAILFYQKSVELAPYQLDFRNKLAGALLDENRIEEARSNYEFIIRENPKYASAYVSLGYLIFANDNNVDKAERMYDIALSLDPDNIQAFFNKAGIRLFLGNRKEAISYLKEVLKRDKKNERASIILKQLE